MSEKPVKKTNRWILVVLFLLFVAPVTASWLLYLNIDRLHLGTTNHGEFVQPPRLLTLPTLPLPLSGGTLGADFFQHRWTLVYAGAASVPSGVGTASAPGPGTACNADCEAALYATRQVRLSMGEQIESVQRLYLTNGKPANADRLARFQPDLTVADVSSPIGTEFIKQLGGEASSGRYIYLVDPRGYLVLRYSVDADPKGLLKDLRHLLGGGGM